MKTYLITYNHDGARWSLELQARDPDDAKARLARLTYGTVDGELMAKIPAAAGPVVILAAAVRNGVSRMFGSGV